MLAKDNPKSTLIEGHRGYAAAYPENTLLSFSAAIDAHVDAFEFDVWLSADKVPVLMHDGICQRTCRDPRHLRDMTLAEIRTLDASYRDKFGDKFAAQSVTVPTLEETLQLCKTARPDIMLGVEIKEYTEETVDRTVALLREFGMFEQAFFYAFHAPTIRYIKTKYDGRTMGYPDFQMRDFTPGDYQYYDEIGLSMTILKSEVAPIFLAKGLPLHLYCADTEEDVRLCLAQTPKLITANDLTPIRRLLGRI